MEKQHDWKEIFTRFMNSDLTINKFCVEEQITINKFRYHRNRLELEGFKFESNGDKSLESTLKRAKRWKLIFEEYRKSKLSIKRFCLINGLCRDQFRYWKEKLYILEGYDFKSPYLPIHDEVKKQNNTFIEFKINDLESDELSKTFRIDLTNVSLVIDSKHNTSFIQYLVKELSKFL